MKYEMRIPPGTPSKLVEEVMEKYGKLEFKQTEQGIVIEPKLHSGHFRTVRLTHTRKNHLIFKNF